MDAKANIYYFKVYVAGIQAVYLAVPLSEKEVRSGMRLVLQERLGADFPMYSSEELFPYVHARYY